MENEDKKIGIRIMSGLLTVALAAGASFVLKPSEAYATGSKIVTSKPTAKYREWAGHKIGQFYDENTGITYNTIEVIENDNASRISEAIIAVYNKEKQIPKEDLALFDKENTKTSRSSFWPGVVYINTGGGMYFSINPGDILIFPERYDKFKEINGQVKASGWYSNFLAKNNIHPPKRIVQIPKELVRMLVQDIYDTKYPEYNVCVDDDTLRAYLRAHSSNIRYEFNRNTELTTEAYYELTQWVPDPEELEDFYPKEPKSKTKTP